MAKPGGTATAGAMVFNGGSPSGAEDHALSCSDPPRPRITSTAAMAPMTKTTPPIMAMAPKLPDEPLASSSTSGNHFVGSLGKASAPMATVHDASGSE